MHFNHIKLTYTSRQHFVLFVSLRECVTVCVCVSGNRCRYTAGKGIKTCAQKLLIHLLRIPETIRQVLAYFNGDG